MVCKWITLLDCELLFPSKDSIYEFDFLPHNFGFKIAKLSKIVEEKCE
jgi:hypothetical protein